MMASTRPEALSRFGAQGPAVPRAEGRFANFLERVSRVISFVPGQLWPRLLILFFVLCAVKAALLLTLGKHLFEIHWRTQTTEIGWVDYLSFAGFVLIGTLTLARLAHFCRDLDIKTVRAANGVVLGLGFVFLVMTFHQGGSNYVYPIAAHVLQWTSLGPYLADDLFFNPPFLVVWLAAYALGYYWLIRSGRESGVLYLTAAFVAGYAPSFLGHLAGFRNELLVLNCVGLISLLSTFRNPGKSRWIWLLLPMAWVAAGAGQLFWRAPSELGLPVRYFLALLAITTGLFTIGTLVSTRYRFSSMWLRFLFFYGTAFLLLANTRYPVAPNFNNALCAGIEFPKYFFGELLVCGSLAVAFAGVFRLNRRVSLFCFDGMALCLIVLAFIDFRISQLLSVRLEWDVLAMGNSPKMIWRMARPYLPVVCVGILGLAILYFGGLFIVNRWFTSGENDEEAAKDS